MATISIGPSDNLRTAILDANQGDVLSMAAGNYPAQSLADITKNADLGGWASFALNVTLRSANPNNQARFNVGRFTMDKVHGITFDGINFRGSANETPIPASAPGVYPDLREAIKILSCRNTRFINCNVSWHLSCLRFSYCDFIDFSRNHFYESGTDNIMGFGSSRDVRIWDNLFDRPKIDYGRHLESDRHPDNIQLRVNTSQVGSSPFYRVSVLRNLFDMDPKSGKPFFGMTQGGLAGTGYVDCEVAYNLMRTGRSNCIVFSGAKNCRVHHNTVISIASKVPSEEPRIWMKGVNNEGGAGAGEIDHNVMHRAIAYSAPAQASHFNIHDNKIDPTGTQRPAGWTEPVAGVNVGPYTDGSEPEVPTAPAQMVQEWANPPTNSIGKDGRVVGAVEAFGMAGRYTGTIVIPTSSVAAAAMATNSLTAYLPVDNLEWTNPALFGWRPCRVANPAVNASGWRRYEMMPGAGDAASVFSVAAGGTMSGITLRYKVDGIASEGSLYTGGFTAPGTPPDPEDIPALEDEGWEVFAVVAEELPGRSTAQIKITGVAYTGAEWTIDGESPPVWRPLLVVGTDGGHVILQLLPSAIGGTEHTVGYEGAPDDTLAIRVRYSLDEAWGPTSATAKSFTGPEEPGSIDGWEAGNVLMDADGVPLRASGILLRIGGADLPPAPQAEDGNPVSVSEGVITVTTPTSPPLGCVDQVVFYDGIPYPVPRENPTVSFPLVEGASFVGACGVTAEGKGGLLAFWPVE